LPALDLDDIQGLILRGYRKPFARHLLLRVDDAAAFKGPLGDLAEEDRASGPFVTVAADWIDKPPAGEVPGHCVNVGFTFDGLRVMGLPDASLDSFPAEFREGTVARAAEVGDTGPSAPEHWVAALTSPDAHVLVSLFADTERELDALTADVGGRLAGGATERGRFDGRALPGEVAHFGYRDGLSQPTIEGAPTAGLPDPFEPVKAGAFVLGLESPHAGLTFLVPQPDALGRNGSFGAFRILRQDCAGFERFLDEGAARTGLDRELVAAKVCGRWRNGVPLALSPTGDTPDPALPQERWNDFDHADDPRGLRCPLGSHVRRGNPRRSRIAGGGGLTHRIVRRGLPYGPPYDPANPDDGVERGLVGMFIGASLRDQFEFLMSEWLNDGVFAPGLGRTKDPLTGANDAGESRFAIPGDPPVEVGGFGRFVTTRGGAYCFLPSMTALRALSAV